LVAAGLDGPPKKPNDACFGFSVFAGAGVVGEGSGTEGALAAGVAGFDPKSELRASVIALGAMSISSAFFTLTFG
jgi:ATP-dependent protease HslVU (ClpYQ) peptidase subunit